MAEGTWQIRANKAVTQYGDGVMGGREVLTRFDPREWSLLWEGRRPSDRDERFRLFKRVP